MTHQLIEKFSRDIEAIDEADFGDFMRAANSYMNQFRKDIEREGIYDLVKKFDEMQLYLQFSPNWDVSSTKARLLKDSQYLDEILAAHHQDWESPPPAP